MIAKDYWWQNPRGVQGKIEQIIHKKVFDQFNIALGMFPKSYDQPVYVLEKGPVMTVEAEYANKAGLALPT